MPRPRKSDAGEVKRRSRTGCWPCKGKKVKCDEERPVCLNCKKNGVKCDYSIRLNWEGRRKKRPEIGGIMEFHTTMSASSASKSESSSGNTVTNESQSSPPLRSATLSATSSSPGMQQQQPLPSVPATRDLEQPMMSPQAAFMSAVLPPLPHSELNPPEDPFQTPRPRSFSQPAQSMGGRPTNLNLSPLDTALQLHDTFLPDGLPSGISHPVLGTINELGDPTPMQFHANHPLLSPTFPETPGAFSESSSPQFSARPSLVGSLGDKDGRRPGLSVNSLLSGPPNRQESQFPHLTVGGHVLFEHDLDSQEEMRFHGIDRGYKDLDIDKNDDMNAISTGDSPIVNRDQTNSYFGNHTGGDGGDATPTAEFGFGVHVGDTKTADNYYYRQPVYIFIPKSFEPLPQKLQENPMNLLYFHHFLNHTAHALVPHDDENSNPFRTILPQMALRNDNLLSLLLAYSGKWLCTAGLRQSTESDHHLWRSMLILTSTPTYLLASHRARLLKQPEPATRIAHWVEDIFPVLRQALNDPNEIISNANLATAIMLASLEIISPRAFGYEISWQKHLSLARDLITARPGGLRHMQVRSRDDPLCSFLWSWFAYLDVLGSLSGGRAHSHTAINGASLSASSAWLLDYDESTPSPRSKAASPPAATCSNTVTAATSPANSAGSPSQHYGNDPRDEIDCIMGFTTRCVAILARIADLARRTDAQRIAGPGRVVAGWRPMPEIEARARKLEDDLRGSLARPHPPCRRHPHSAGLWDDAEMHATNEAFHYAGLVHLHRRVLGKPSGDPDVQNAVMHILQCLEKVKRGGNAEACLLFPIFTAGCDSSDEAARKQLLERVITVESNGMTQVHRARTLMEKVWDTSQPWETLISTEFIG